MRPSTPSSSRAGNCEIRYAVNHLHSVPGFYKVQYEVSFTNFLARDKLGLAPFDLELDRKE